MRPDDDCWCGMDHSRVEMDQDGNWFEWPDENEEGEAE